MVNKKVLYLAAAKSSVPSRGVRVMKDQDVLDIVCDVSRELRFSPTFCAMLHKLDADEARRCTGRYLEFLYKVLEEGHTPASL